MNRLTRKLIAGKIGCFCISPFLVFASGIHEPPIVQFGTVMSETGLSVSGPLVLEWMVNGDGSYVVARPTFVRVNELSFYFLRIPCETRVVGDLLFPPSPNTLPLPIIPTFFTRTVTVNGYPATLVPPAATNFVFSKADRGKVERVDLMVALPEEPPPDADRDGVPDWAELIAGTDPNDSTSVFKASTDLQPAPTGGFIIRWSSVAGKSYTLFRSTDLGQNFTPVSGVLAASPPQNQFMDATATERTLLLSHSR